MLHICYKRIPYNSMTILYLFAIRLDLFVVYNFLAWFTWCQVSLLYSFLMTWNRIIRITYDVRITLKPGHRDGCIDYSLRLDLGSLCLLLCYHVMRYQDTICCVCAVFVLCCCDWLACVTSGHIEITVFSMLVFNYSVNVNYRYRTTLRFINESLYRYARYCIL